MRSLLWCVTAALVVASTANANNVLLVVGVEYTAHPDHYGISGIGSTLDEYAYQGQPIPPHTQRATDILALLDGGERPLTWLAHPNWMYGAYPPALQTANLIGLVNATGQAWWPDAIAMLNVGIDPSYEMPSNWRRQMAIEMGNSYSSQVPSDHIPAFLLEVDFHRPPTVFWHGCGHPYSKVWVPANWHELPAHEAMEELFRAVRDRRVVGTVGGSRFGSCEISGNLLTLQLTNALQNVQLWAGGADPVATWANTATAAYDLSRLDGGEPFVWFFAYGDSLAGNWNMLSCRSKEVFFTSPMVRNGSTFDNQYSAENLEDRVPIEVLFHQHTRLSIDGGAAPTMEELVTECQIIGVDAVLTTDHIPSQLTGPFPSFIHTWGEVPTTAVWGSEPADVVAHALQALPSPSVVGESVTIRYTLGQAARVKLEIYDVNGRLVRSMRDELRVPGRYIEEARFSAPGVYFAQLQVGRDIYTKKLSVLR